MVSLLALTATALVGCVGEGEGEEETAAIASSDEAAIGGESAGESTGIAQEACGYDPGWCGCWHPPRCWWPRPRCYPPPPCGCRYPYGDDGGYGGYGGHGDGDGDGD
jgi:hypothetical protein